jgi:hypothetical protein
MRVTAWDSYGTRHEFSSNDISCVRGIHLVKIHIEEPGTIKDMENLLTLPVMQDMRVTWIVEPIQLNLFY